MPTKTISGDLSVKGIRSLIKKLTKYKDNLESKTQRFVQRLADEGIPAIEQNIVEAGFTYDEKGVMSGSNTAHSTYVQIQSLGSTVTADLIIEGDEILFIEFGAGVYYNGEAGASPHPKGEEFAFTIGSYGKGNGVKKIWGYYDDAGELILTHGTKATMPVYKASREIIDKYVAIAREVFGGG